MMTGIKYELKKYVFTKQTLTAMLILTIAGAAMLFVFNMIPIFDSDIKDRMKFFARAGDSYSDEDKQRFMKDKEEVDRELGLSETNIIPDGEKMWQKGKYTNSKWYDHYCLSYIIGCIEYVEKRNMITETVSNDSNVFSSDYYREDNRVLADRRTISGIVHDMFFGWLSCIAVIIIFSSSFSVEYGNSIYNVLCITKKGYWSLCRGKMLSALLVSVAVNVYFWGIYLIGENMIRRGISPDTWNKPLFLAENFIMCASGKTIADMLAMQVAASILVTVLAAVLTMFWSMIIKKGLYSLTAALLSIVLMLIPNIADIISKDVLFLETHPEFFPISEPEFYKLMEAEKTFNPFSLIRFQYYAVQPQYIEILGSYYPLYCMPVVIAILLTAIFCCILLCGEKRGI